ncbi:MAG: phosphoglycerate dehydrogenase [Firmicutes bacterium]|nr:phosphoglycerate dehydrogenase [Bacillota bacterium]
MVKNSRDRPLTSEELAELIRDADAVIVGNDKVDAAAIGAAQRLKVISRYGVGFDNIDLVAASARGIVVTNTPGANDNSVADFAMALILACARGIPTATGLVKGGEWTRVFGVEVWQKTLGVIGVGRIGRGVVHRAGGFNMKVLCYDVIKKEQWAKTNRVTYACLEEVLQQSDFVTVHVPLLPSTRGLISRRELGMMKPSAYIINTARGGIVDEDALYEALVSGKIAGAALDVLEREPATDSPLVKLDNVLITAHMGGYTRDAVRNMGVMAAQNVVDVLTGAGSHFLVNG